VLTQFLVESIVMATLGGVAGLVFGITGAKVLAAIRSRPCGTSDRTGSSIPAARRLFAERLFDAADRSLDSSGSVLQPAFDFQLAVFGGCANGFFDRSLHLTELAFGPVRRACLHMIHLELLAQLSLRVESATNGAGNLIKAAHPVPWDMRRAPGPRSPGVRPRRGVPHLD
jgi:hypothetical protein